MKFVPRSHLYPRALTGPFQSIDMTQYAVLHSTKGTATGGGLGNGAVYQQGRL